MTFLTVTRRPSGNRGQGPTNGRARPEPDTVVLWVSGPLGRVSHNLNFPLSAEPLKSSCLMTPTIMVRWEASGP